MSGGNDELERLRLYKAMTEGNQSGVARLQGGRQTIAAIAPTRNATAPNDLQSLLEWNGPPTSLEWQNQFQVLATGGGSTEFPPKAYSSDWAAGAYYNASNVWAGGDGEQTCLLAKIETGSGPLARSYYADLRVGRFALGVQERVKISVGRWYADDAFGRTVEIQAAVGPAQAGDCDPPTFTATTAVVAGATKTMVQPPGALWWDFAVDQFGAQVAIETDTIQGVNRGLYFKDTTAAAPIVFPPASPYPALANGGLYNARNYGSVDCFVTMTFWVR